MMHKLSFCPLCGAQLRYEVPPGDNRERPVCSRCGHVHYMNPTTVVGAVAMYGDRVLLCKRSIEPRSGYWTLPAGYLELEEDAESGAMREAREEALADIEIRHLLALYCIPHISQTQLIFLADLRSDEISAGEESEEVGLFLWDEIPWAELAFPTVKWALDHARKMLADPSIRAEERSTAEFTRRAAP